MYQEPSKEVQVHPVLSESSQASLEELREEEIKHLQFRTGQLFELISFDPGNEQIYRNEIIELNIRLVPIVLRKYKPFNDDQFQTGCVGLIIATRTFDVSRGVPFSSYACFCIERELHKVHRDVTKSIEYTAGSNLFSLDEYTTLDNGDTVNMHEQIPDILSEEMFKQLLEENELINLFDSVIIPAIDSISKSTKGQNSKVDFTEWKDLELRYILEMSEIDSQKSRFTLSKMSEMLGVSTQNIRMRHQRVIQRIRERCIQLGYLKEELNYE